MKKKIVILGSTGSIGVKTVDVFKKDKKNFQIVLLSTNSNLKKIINQAKELNVKNIIINNKKVFKLAKKNKKLKKINIFNSFDEIKKIIKTKKIYYSMISIVGLDGLKPTMIMSKYSKNLAIVNKESLICGWELIKKNFEKNKTNFIPIDSEHFSIYTLLKSYKINDIEKIYITASGGPFLNYPKKRFKLIVPKKALNHPNWKMGKKITIDSATLMNKLFEVIEAKNIFNIPYHKISILTHPASYVHSIVKFKNGITKILIHEADMKIPIINSIYQNKLKKIKTKKLDINLLNNLDLKEVDLSKFPTIKLLKKLPIYNSLYETVLITINDYFVYKFLENKITFTKLLKLICKISCSNEFLKYKKIRPKSIEDIYKLRDYVSLKLSKLGI